MKKYSLTKNKKERGKIKDGKIEKLVVEIGKKKARILDDFCKAYFADKQVAPSKVELVEDHSQLSQGKIIYYFRIKLGRPKTMRKEKKKATVVKPMIKV